MSWSFGTNGSKAKCAALIETDTAPADAANRTQHDLACALLKRELDAYGDDSANITMGASGTAPADGGAGDRSFSVWMSGPATEKSAAHVEVHPEVPPTAPLTKRHR